MHLRFRTSWPALLPSASLAFRRGFALSVLPSGLCFCLLHQLLHQVETYSTPQPVAYELPFQSLMGCGGGTL